MLTDVRTTARRAGRAGEGKERLAQDSGVRENVDVRRPGFVPLIALALLSAACARREAKVTPDAGAPAPRADAAAVHARAPDAARKPDAGVAAQAEEEPPYPYLFMFDERSVVLRETILIPEEGIWDSLVGPPRRIDEFVAVRGVDIKRLPPELAGWRGRKVQLMSDEGPTCVATIKALRVAARIGLPSAADESRWLGQSDRKVARAIWESSDARHRFEGVLAGACADSTWARPADLRVPRVLPAKAPSEAVERAAKAAFRKLPAWTKLQADHAAFRKEHPSSELTDAGEPEFASVRAGDTELVEVRSHIRDEPGGCDFFEANFWTLWKVTRGERRGLSMVLVGGPRRGEFQIQMSGAADLDGDGVPDILLKERQGYVRRSPSQPGYDEPHTIDLYSFYCP